MFAEESYKRDVDAKIEEESEDLEEGVGGRIGAKAVLAEIASEKTDDDDANCGGNNFTHEL